MIVYRIRKSLSPYQICPELPWWVHDVVDDNHRLFASWREAMDWTSSMVRLDSDR